MKTFKQGGNFKGRGILSSKIANYLVKLIKPQQCMWRSPMHCRWWYSSLYAHSYVCYITVCFCYITVCFCHIFVYSSPLTVENLPKPLFLQAQMDLDCRPSGFAISLHKALLKKQFSSTHQWARYYLIPFLKKSQAPFFKMCQRHLSRYFNMWLCGFDRRTLAKQGCLANLSVPVYYDF